ncbi:MAG TPA: peptidoglycan DD-metalloendopeptidase family protein [Solirubrobacteraceae bacterium]|nr:peptidoglycan DD-metalloendopeptidase family protein [Solirubrobacteraceae bacterium]
MRRIIATTLVLAAFPAAAHAWILDQGDRGEAVREVQRTLTELGLRTVVDGAFGPATARNVRRYERREELAVDGRVSRGQLRGMLRRAGRTLPPSLEEEPRRARPRAAPADGGFAFPIDGDWEWGRGETGFGDRGGAHRGEDVFAGCGTPLVAAEAGEVVFSDTHASAGHYLVVHGAGTGEDFVYMHLQSAPRPDEGDTVAAGERIGAVGRSGNASACHLHFEIWTAPGWYDGGEPRDPRPDLERWAS